MAAEEQLNLLVDFDLKNSELNYRFFKHIMCSHDGMLEKLATEEQFGMK
jgi:hypothetical protein